MKRITKFTCLAALGAALAGFNTASASEGCCEAMTPLAAEAKTDAAAKPYPLNTCVVSGEKLGADPDMKPYSFVRDGQEVKLCCKSCLKKFDKSPETYMKKISEAAAKK